MGAEVEGLDLPLIDAGEHLITYLFDVGPSVGGEVLSYSEIAAWLSISGVVISPWEAETLRKLSAAYLAEREAAKSPDRPLPESPPAED